MPAIPVIDETILHRAPVLAAMDETTVRAIARRVHDSKCRAGGGCGRRDSHALDSHGNTVRQMLNAMADASEAHELSDVAPF
ncbi:hypothetical protein V6N00_13365 [Tersicoccus sp. MR15.9]|uniref:hypothetical protein n=1 Tax=Tersicoccus mangrovi TaxID=3121635 RepID=UPI002FE5E4BC